MFVGAGKHTLLLLFYLHTIGQARHAHLAQSLVHAPRIVFMADGCAFEEPHFNIGICAITDVGGEI